MDTSATSHINDLGPALPIHITEKCNLKCSYCYLGDTKTLIKDEIVDEVIKELNPPTIFWYGGEPMMYKEKLKEWILKYSHLNHTIATNGTLVEPEDVAFFSEHGVHLKVSLDTLYQEEQAEVRGLDKFQFSKALKLVFEHPEICSVAITATKDSETISRLVRSLDAEGVRSDLNFAFDESEEEVHDCALMKDLRMNPWLLKKICIGPGSDKLRLHCDGNISRSITRDNNVVCSWDDIPEKVHCLGKRIENRVCESCPAQLTCDLNNAFGHERERLSDKLGNLTICKLHKEIYNLMIEENVLKNLVFVTSDKFDELDYMIDYNHVIVSGVPPEIFGQDTIMKIMKRNDANYTILCTLAEFHGSLSGDSLGMLKVLSEIGRVRFICMVELNNIEDVKRMKIVSEVSEEFGNVILGLTTDFKRSEYLTSMYSIFSECPVYLNGNIVTDGVVDYFKFMEYCKSSEMLSTAVGPEMFDTSLYHADILRVITEGEVVQYPKGIYCIDLSGVTKIESMLVEDIVPNEE